ncbi:MAG: HAMP domain-containing histidine kinase [Sphingomonadales bacterium]|nr:HAMP domain-containing histidine kinase [Sphingomonadales bacterium]
MTGGGTILARAASDGDDRLISAEEPLAGLQLRCGGELPGMIAVPALLEIVRKARRFGLKLARPVTAQDGQESITAWVEVEPAPGDQGGCLIWLRNWQSVPLPPEDPLLASARRTAIDRTLAELTARLDARQCLLSVESEAPDLAALVTTMRVGTGRPWTDFVEIEGGENHRQPMHWRLLDGAGLKIDGSARHWRAALIPQQIPVGEPASFELCLTADSPLPPPSSLPPEPVERSAAVTGNGLVGRDLAPVLRQPISRIIANAETIRTRLAGPLAEEYAAYAADIATAGQHLLALIEDMTDLEVVEAEDFVAAPDPIDLADVARRAAGILGVRARERGILIDAPREGESLPAIAEFRRALQVLLNLVGNAIHYSPTNSQIWIRLELLDGRARVIVADQGPGMSTEQQGRVFEKFERLGRSGDGGSGLGLYISRRLARAMGGDLTVESAPGQGARFTLDLPGDPSRQVAPVLPGDSAAPAA